MSAKRAEKFGELLSRAAHVAGFTKMLMIAIFPWLIFFVVAGRWKVLIYWFALFTSVSLWAPIWTLLYHIVTNIALSAEVMEAFGRLHDNVSLYSSQLITSRIYKMYSVYSWLQIILGPIPTVILAHQLAPLLRDTEQEHAPEGIKEITAVGVKVASPAK